MPFQRPTLSELRALVAQDLAAALPGSDPLLRFSNLAITGEAQAGLAHLHYGYLDWIAKQSNPFTATDEYLEAWAALKDVFRIPANPASGSVTFPGTNGAVLASGVALSRADGKKFVTTSSGTVTSGSVTVTAVAVDDPEGLTGAWGNMAIGARLTLSSSVDGVQSTGAVSIAFSGGADIELDDSLRARMLYAYQNPQHGGSASDYVKWAKDCPGVTRAWCPVSTMGPGTVQVFVMLDDAQAAHDGFPQGVNGVATLEGRDAPATGDQLAIANAIFPLQPVTALVYVVAPQASPVPFVIAGLSSASSTVKANVSAAIKAALVQYGDLGGKVYLSQVESAIASVSGSTGFIVTSPALDISVAAGHLPTLGTVTFS